MLLLAGQGVANSQIAASVGVTPVTAHPADAGSALAPSTVNSKGESARGRIRTCDKRSRNPLRQADVVDPGIPTDERGARDVDLRDERADVRADDGRERRP